MVLLDNLKLMQITNDFKKKSIKFMMDLEVLTKISGVMELELGCDSMGIWESEDVEVYR